ncbi:MAG: sigma-70 family RNA polymerase sigma factor [Candidatus Omnitrophica bacterium]|nr:sigma-70 family RNA polymerase sigma factor [Candidatus Omnitrophota bacterium]
MDFKILLERIKPALRAVARKYLLYGFHDEEDLYQEMCLYLWQEYSEGLPIGINESYVIKGCEFHILNYLRKGKRRYRVVSIDEPVSAEGEALKDIIPDPRSAFLSDLDSRLTIEDIKSKKLTERERKVLSLLIEGHTVRDIAAQMGISHVMVVKHKKSIFKKFSMKGYQT